MQGHNFCPVNFINRNMVGHFLSSDIIASRFWHDLNLKPDVRMLQVLKMKALLLSSNQVETMPTFVPFADVLYLPQNQNNYSDYTKQTQSH